MFSRFLFALVLATFPATPLELQHEEDPAGCEETVELAARSEQRQIRRTVARHEIVEQSEIRLSVVPSLPRPVRARLRRPPPPPDDPARLEAQTAIRC